MTTLQVVELGVLGPLQVRQDRAPVNIPGAKPRAILTMLGLHSNSVVSAETFVELLWGENPPRTAAKALQTHISLLRRALGEGFVLTQGAGWTLADSEVDASRYKSLARRGRDAAAAGDTSQAVACFEDALALWRGIPELPDGRRGASEKTRWVEGHAALVEDRADALLATGRAAEIVGELEAAVGDAPLRERRWGQLMLALYRAGRQGEALGAYQRARALLADELGVDPGPNLRRLEAAVVAQDVVLEIPAAQQLTVSTRAVTFLLTDIEGSTAAWEAAADAMAVALARHDELVEQVVTLHGGRLIKTRGEGDATFSVFDRPSAAAAAAIELQEAIAHEPWTLAEPMRIRVALHTGEVELRDGDYFGRAVNRAARLRSLAIGGQTLCSGATAELVIDSLRGGVILADLGMRQLRNLARPEHVFELRLQAAELVEPSPTSAAPMDRPGLPSVLIGSGPFVGRGTELERLCAGWQTALGGDTRAVLIAGEPGVGKTRLAGEWSRQAYEQGAVVLYGRCDEDLGAPYQPFAEALRSLVPCVGAGRLRGLRGVEALLPLVPGLVEILPDLAAPTRADPDTERYALFDAVVALVETASTEAPVVLVLDDLHWAAKPTLLLLRHLLRFGDHSRVQIVGTYRSTDLDRSHPLAAMLADLHRDGTANRLALSGLDEDDVTTYVSQAGYDDAELGRALASVTGGNPFFLIEALRHVDESGGAWDPSTLPQGVREAVSRRLSRLPVETNNALAAAAVVGSRFALDLVERVVGDDLVDAFDEASKAGIVIEERGGRYRFNHALVRQSLLAELPSVRRMRLHQRIANTLEDGSGVDDELLAELAHHYFECAWAGNAAKAVEYCRRAANQAMTRLGYEAAADLFDRALHALDELDDELPDRDDQVADLLVARCEALLAAGDVASAAGAVQHLQRATVNSARLSAWATCFDGQLSISIHPERLDDVEAALAAAARRLAEIDDAAGEAKAHTVRATCLARLGRIGDCEVALDDALTAARRAQDHRRVNAVLAGAPLAALWGPNPVPRAGGRCLDVVRLLRITTDSPAVEATSTRCQAVLEAFRGRAAAARRMIDSARRTVTELGLRHALLEVEQFAGIVELVLDDPAGAEPHLRQACNGFRRMGLDADTAETAALLGRACLALDRDAEANELCTESERLAGHALKPSIAWRAVRAQLLSRSGDHGQARSVAQAAITLAECTDALVDHGDACLALATVLGTAGDAAGARAAAERAVDLYERKGAAALADKARRVIGEKVTPVVPAIPETPKVEAETDCVRAIRRIEDAMARESWGEVEQQLASHVTVEGRRTVVGFPPVVMTPSEWAAETKRLHDTGVVRHRNEILAVRGERLALTRSELGTDDESPGAPQVDVLRLFGLDDEGRIASLVAFDVDDMDAAMAELDAMQRKFEELQSPARRLENAATRLFERFWTHFAAGDRDALVDTMTADVVGIDHRRVVNAGTLQGRDAVTADLQVAADVGFTISMVGAIAMRGECLALVRTRASGHDAEAIQNDALNVIEIDSAGRLVAAVTFDVDDFDAAIVELDTRYAAREAATYARTWSVIRRAYLALNQREMPPTTPDWVNIDHRRGSSFAPGQLPELLATWTLAHTVNSYIEVVHRLNDRGALFSSVSRETSQEGFEAEWRSVGVIAVDQDLIYRLEVFDEEDLDAAIAQFDELSRPTPQLQNAAARTYQRILTHFAARDWAAVRDTLADDISAEDRRRPVNAPFQHGKEAVVALIASIAAVGITELRADVVATRGERLVLCRGQASGPDQQSDAFRTDLLDVVEIDANERVVSSVVFDLDDFAAAIVELDVRYLAGEGAAQLNVLQPAMETVGELNRQEFGPMLGRIAFADHRRVPFGSAEDYGRVIEELWALVPDARYWMKTVHALDAHGLVSTLVIEGTDAHGNELQWGRTFLFLPHGLRVEVYEDDSVDAALARLEDLRPPASRLDNVATRMQERVWSYIAARDWAAVARVTAENVCVDDRRRVVNAGVLHGRDANIESTRATVDVGFTMTGVGTLATRGERLALLRVRVSGGDAETIQNDALNIVEVDAEERIAANVVYDLDDFDAAIAELDARYLAGEGAAHARAWSVLAGVFPAHKRREIAPTTPDAVSIDPRRGVAFAPGEGAEYIRAGGDLGQDLSIYIEQVHRVNDLGAVFTWAGHGTFDEGFDADWRGITVMTVSGETVSRCEMFDEDDLDAALARFDGLRTQSICLANSASQVTEGLTTSFATGDWNGLSRILSDDVISDDRRRVVNAGIRHGRDAVLRDARATAELGLVDVTSTVIATRGERLVLRGARYSGEAFDIHILSVLEIDAEDRVVMRILFDLDDEDAAFEELEARYLAGEAAAHAHTWSVITGNYAAMNRHELFATTPDWTNVDHRQPGIIEEGGVSASLVSLWKLVPDITFRVEAVYRLSDRGTVCRHAARGVSQQGFDAEWRGVVLLTVDGDLINRCEIFDETDLEAALAKFAGLHS